MANIALPKSVQEREAEIKAEKTMYFLSNLVVSKKYPETINMEIAGKVSIRGVDVTNGKSDMYMLEVKNGEDLKRYVFVITEEPKKGINQEPKEVTEEPKED